MPPRRSPRNKNNSVVKTSGSTNGSTSGSTNGSTSGSTNGSTSSNTNTNNKRKNPELSKPITNKKSKKSTMIKVNIPPPPPIPNKEDMESANDDSEDEDWREELPDHCKVPANRANRVLPSDEQIDDLAKDYVDSYKMWRKVKKRLVVLYNETAIMRDQMVCENCKEIVDITDEVIVNNATDGLQNPENAHIEKIIEKHGELYEVYNCRKRNYNQLFVERVSELDDSDSDDNSDDNSDEYESDEDEAEDDS